MKAVGLRNALFVFAGGLITWGLLVWLPHRELLRLSDYLGRPDNLPPVTRNVYGLQHGIYSYRYGILAIFIIACFGYYHFYNWVSEKRKPRMLIHNLTLFAAFLGLYGLLIYTIVGLRVATRGITG